MSGFLEFGLLALVGFVFMNVAGGWMLINHLPPTGVAEAAARDWKRWEEGIQIEGATLVTPQLAEKTLVS